MFASVPGTQIDESAARRIPGIGPRRPRKQDEIINADVASVPHSVTPTAPRRPIPAHSTSNYRSRPTKPYQRPKPSDSHMQLPGATPVVSSTTAVTPAAPASSPSTAISNPLPSATTVSVPTQPKAETAKVEKPSTPNVPRLSAPLLSSMRKPAAPPNWTLTALFAFCFAKAKNLYVLC